MCIACQQILNREVGIAFGFRKAGQECFMCFQMAHRTCDLLTILKCKQSKGS